MAGVCDFNVSSVWRLSCISYTLRFIFMFLFLHAILMTKSLRQMPFHVFNESLQNLE